jgi:hypothetical protein
LDARPKRKDKKPTPTNAHQRTVNCNSGEFTRAIARAPSGMAEKK